MSNPLGHQAAAVAPAALARTRPPLRIVTTILHLVALGLGGSLVFALTMVLLGLGLGLMLVFGIGLLFLVALIYVLFGLAWFETERVNGLYDLSGPPLRTAAQRGEGLGGFI
ncbi:MAG: sensor histidine kinase, partial [Leucobacter sp.]|nr:sensor histidine kinase [Leucobacter sp.]